MPRYRRRIAAGSVQHLISRFVNRQFLFDAPGAREEYLARAARTFARSDWTAIGYALMSSHVHWIAIAGSNSSDTLMRSLHGGFSGWINRSTVRLGPVFADRHRNVECESETAIVMLAYIHNNPIRAGVVADPTDSGWTSHRAYIGIEPAPTWLNVELGLHLCGLDPTATGRAMFHDYVIERATQPRQPQLAASNLQHARSDARRTTALPVELASPRIARESGRPECLVQSIEHVIPALSPMRLRWTASPLIVLRAVASSNGVSELELRGRSRTRRISKARRQAVLVWALGLCRPVIEMARALGIASTTASDHLGKCSMHEREEAMHVAQALLISSSLLEHDHHEGTKNELP